MAFISKGKKKKKEIDESFCDDSISMDMRFEETKDPATIVANFKEAERMELESMITLRTKNERKHNDENPDARFCVCHKPSTSNMIQCDLCKDWFHGSCVPLPKPVYLKKHQQEGSVGFVDMNKDMKFLCPLCLRSRRPRLETILSLLVSLQKLPVRLPEGEALQCLTERGMSWQDQAKQALKSDEVSAALATLTIISQQKSELAYCEKSEQIINSEIRKAANNPELKPHLQNVASGAFRTLQNPDSKSEEIIQKWRNLATPNVSQISDSSAIQLQPRVEETVPVVAAVQEVPSSNPVLPVETVDLTTESTGSTALEDTPANHNMEHAYSSVSKTSATTTPRKHARKSPLVTRQMESPVLQLSESTKNQLEQLMMEGDLLEMTLDESHEIWKLLQATKLGRDSFSVSPFSDIEDNIRVERKKAKKHKVDSTKGSVMKSKMAKNRLKMQLKENKQKKNKLRLGGKLLGPLSAMGESKLKKSKSDSKREGTFHFKKEMKDGSVKTVKMRAKLFDKPKKPGSKNKGERIKGDMRENELDDTCSAASCLRPIGEAVNWVQCDGGCEQWFHLLCVGLDVTEVNETEDYICPNCVNPELLIKEEAPYFEENAMDFESASKVAVSVLAGFAKNSFDKSVAVIDCSSPPP